jgi:hypothetical protein
MVICAINWLHNLQIPVVTDLSLSRGIEGIPASV